jgi:hypothetical protein
MVWEVAPLKRKREVSTWIPDLISALDLVLYIIQGTIYEHKS